DAQAEEASADPPEQRGPYGEPELRGDTAGSVGVHDHGAPRARSRLPVEREVSGAAGRRDPERLVHRAVVGCVAAGVVVADLERVVGQSRHVVVLDPLEVPLEVGGSAMPMNSRRPPWALTR